MSESADIVIVGAGIMGLSIAHQMLRRDPKRGIVLLEGARNVGEGSTGASCAILRQRYSYPDAIRAARDGHHAYQNWGAFTGLAEPRAEFHQTGTLWLMGETRAQVTEDYELMKSLDIDVSVFEPADVHARFPSGSVGGELVDLTFARFSGHGFKEAPAVGSMIARWPTGDTIEMDPDADMAFFAFDRQPHTPDAKTVLA